jgi:hypothetical protein
VFAINTAGGSIGNEIERVCTDNELVITTWSPIHLRAKLRELYWNGGTRSANAAAFFEDTLRYLYMPRLRNRDVLTQAIRSGSARRDFFATAYGESEGKFEGFSFGGGQAVFDDTLLLIDPDAAKTCEESIRPAEPVSTAEPATTSVASPPPAGAPLTSGPATQAATPLPASVKPKVFYGSADIPPATAKMHLVNLADEIIALLASDPNANVRLTVEISAEFPEGASDSIKRAVSENATSLRLKSAEWE